jgi:hypothetical protein
MDVNCVRFHMPRPSIEIFKGMAVKVTPVSVRVISHPHFADLLASSQMLGRLVFLGRSESSTGSPDALGFHQENGIPDRVCQ